jgi:predicted ester cyclase
MTDQAIIGQLRRRITPELYRKIRRLWKTHVTAEDARDIPTILTTLTEDCVFEIVQSGDMWRGHTGATDFHRELFAAFPDVRFDLQNVVIGPQGVYQEIILSGTFAADWRAYKAHGGPVSFAILVLYPWDMEQGKFTGERVYVASDDALRG